MISFQGKGNFVRDRSRHRRYGIDRYSRSVWAGTNPQPLLIAEGNRQGREVGQQTTVELTPAPGFVAERLTGVQPGESLHVRRRTTTLDGETNQTADSYFSQATAERSTALLTGEGGGGHIARINAVSPVREVQEELTARMPTTAESARLSIPTGTPVIELLRSYHTDEGTLDVTHFIIRADLATFDYRFPIPD